MLEKHKRTCQQKILTQFRSQKHFAIYMPWHIRQHAQAGKNAMALETVVE
jgi:hypothetical protein